MITILTNTLKTLALGFVLGTSVYPAQAAVNTYVSRTGADVGVCDAANPCATFQFAINHTDLGGIVTAVDSGSYGSVSISQSVTIDGTGTQANIIISTGNAVKIADGPTDTVVLRHLSLTGLSGSIDGVDLQNGSLEMDDCHISGFDSHGFFLSAEGSALVENTVITRCYTGISCDSSGQVSLRNVTLRGNSYGLTVGSGPVDISHSLITQNTSAGVYAFHTTLSVLNCILTNNATAVEASTGSTIRLTNNDIFNNTVGLFSTSTSGVLNDPVGVISTAGNNHKAGNPTPGAPTPGKIIVTQ